MKRILIVGAVIASLLGVGGAVLYFTVLRTTEPKELTREEIRQKEYNELKAMLEEHIPELEKAIEPALLEEFKKQEPNVRTRVRDTIENKNHQLMNDKQRYRFIDVKGVSYVGDENNISIFSKLLWRKINKMPLDVDAVIAEYDKVVELWRAVDNNDIEAAKKLIAEGVSPNRSIRGHSEETIFSKALTKKDRQMIDLLVAGMKFPDEKANFGKTPLLYATEENNTEVVRALLKKGADPNSTDESSWGSTAIFSAVEHGNIELLRLLLENGVDVNHENGLGLTVLSIFNDYCSKGDIVKTYPECNRSIKDLLLSKGAKLLPMYFPEEKIHKFANSWFSGVLRKAKEESLMRERTHETFRFTWLRSFHPDVVIRIQDTDKEKEIVTKIAAPREEKASTPFTEKKRVLSKEEWVRLKALVKGTGFMEMPNKSPRRGADGAMWILEAAGKSPYKFVFHWSPTDDDPLKKLCLYILSLSGEKFDPIY